MCRTGLRLQVLHQTGPRRISGRCGMTLPPGLQAVRDRADKATAGPWTLEYATTSCGYAWKVLPIGACLYVDSRGGVCNPDMDGATATANAELLAAARTDVPALLDLIETLAGALEKVTPFKTSHLCDCEACRNCVRAALEKCREFK